MTNKEIVFGVMKQHPCVTGVQIHDYAYQIFGEVITPQSATGVLRPYAAKGLVVQSKHPFSGRNVYWLTKKGEEVIADEFSF